MYPILNENNKANRFRLNTVCPTPISCFSLLVMFYLVTLVPTLYLLLLSLLLVFVRVGSLYESTRVKESMLCERIMGSAWEW